MKKIPAKDSYRSLRSAGTYKPARCPICRATVVVWKRRNVKASLLRAEALADHMRTLHRKGGGFETLGDAREFCADRFAHDGVVLSIQRQPSAYETIRAGSRVTIVNRFGQEHSGRAVMLGPAGWVLNMGGAHGTPAIATPENVVRVKGGVR